tara:strand:- start:421 stop:705 length:285 start_codon:yes stop_codon:yes gene_type:complete
MKGKPIEVSATAGILSIKIQDREIINERIVDKWLFDLSFNKAISYKEAIYAEANKCSLEGDYKGEKELRETYRNFNRYVIHYDLVQDYINQINQ